MAIFFISLIVLYSSEYYPRLFKQNAPFFCFIHRKKLTNLIILEMHRFSDQFLITRENATKPILWRKSGKLVLILCLLYGCFFSIGFLSYGRLHIWEIHGFPNQLPIVWENATVPILQGEIGTHTFPIV